MNSLQRAYRSAVLLPFLLACGSACNNDSTSPNPLPTLEGTWIATSFVVTLLDGGGPRDLVAEGGGLRLDFASNGDVVTTTTDSETGETDVDVGSHRVLSDTRLELRLRANEELLLLDYVLAGATLTLSGRFEVDITDDGTLRPADLVAILVKS